MSVSWEGLHADLVARLLALSDGAVLLVRGPESSARPVPATDVGLLKKLLAPAYVDQPPWVRLQRDEDHLRGWCVGPGERGRGFPLSGDELGAITALGWHRPGPLEGFDFLRWWPDDVAVAAYLPRSEGEAAADLALRTLREVFTIDDPRDIALEASPTA